MLFKVSNAYAFMVASFRKLVVKYIEMNDAHIIMALLIKANDLKHQFIFQIL